MRIRSFEAPASYTASGPAATVILLFLISAICACSAHMAPNTIKSESADLHRQLAERYYQKKDYPKARSELLLLIAEEPRNAKAHYRLGVIYGRQGALQKSLDTFLQVISIDPQYGNAYYNIAVLYTKSGKKGHIQKSIRFFNKYLELEPDTGQREQIERWKALHP